LKILADRYGYMSTVEELKEEWLFDLLIHVGIEQEVLEAWDNSNIVQLFFDNHIEIINYPSFGGIMVTYKGEVVGEWGGPELVMKYDHEIGEPYYEITIENWSILEEE